MKGRTALVTGGGTVLGRAISLALSARGVGIVVTGRDEKALGETVGEVVYGGGKARHVVGQPGDAAHLAAALERASAVFGPVDIAVVAEADAAETTLNALSKQIGSPGCLLLALSARAGAPPSSAFVRELSLSSSARAVTCNAILVDPAAEEDAGEDAAELAVHLCSAGGDRITGQCIALGHAVRTRPRG